MKPLKQKEIYLHGTGSSVIITEKELREAFESIPKRNYNEPVHFQVLPKKLPLFKERRLPRKLKKRRGKRSYFEAYGKKLVKKLSRNVQYAGFVEYLLEQKQRLISSRIF